MTWCDHCRRPEPQLADHVDNHGRITYLCYRCWDWARYWDTIEPKARLEVAS